MVSVDTTKRYDVNPFVGDAAFISHDRRVVVATDPDVYVQQSTGQVAHSEVVSYRKVDSQRFVKLFAENIGWVFGMTGAGTKALYVVQWALQRPDVINRDVLELTKWTLSEFQKTLSEKASEMSLAYFRRGISELISCGVLAKTKRRGRYFINPHFMFNGDRIRFSQVIEREKPAAARTRIG